MPRKKVKLAWIVNDSARRATFRKRKKGLMKKISELSTLCGIDACAIIYGPSVYEETPFDEEPEVWPSPAEAEKVVKRFKNLPDMEKSKKMMNQEEFLRQRIMKLRDQMNRQQRENREYEMTELMYQTLGGFKGLRDVECSLDLGDLAWLIDDKIKAVQDRIDTLRGSSSSSSDQQQQQQQHLITFRDERMNQEDNKLMMTFDMEALHNKHPWFVQMINPHDDQHHNVGFVGDHFYEDNTSNYSWPNHGFFP